MNKRIAVFVCVMLGCLSSFSQAIDSELRKNLIRVNISSLLFDVYSIGYERVVNTKSSLVLELGAISTGRDEDPFRTAGIATAVGAKFFLSNDHDGLYSGFTFCPMITYRYFKDWTGFSGSSPGQRWENSFGIEVRGSYVFTLGNRFVLEPWVGVGYRPTWATSYFAYFDGIQAQVVKQQWRSVSGDNVQSDQAQIQILNDLVLTGGIQVGIRF